MTVKKQFDQLMDALDRPELGSDPYRFQNYLRGYQDIFSTGLNMFGAHAFDYTTTDEDGRFSNEVVELIPMEVGSVVANAFGNILLTGISNFPPLNTPMPKALCVPMAPALQIATSKPKAASPRSTETISASKAIWIKHAP